MYIQQKRKTLSLLNNRMILSQNQRLHTVKQRFLTATAKLDAMSPLKVLTRGYSMVQNSSGDLIRSVHQVTEGESIHVLLGDGVMETEVISAKENLR